MTSIYQQMLNENIPIDNHESDLYVPVTKKSLEIIEQYEHKSNVTQFVSQIDGKLWFDIPFAFMPWWENRCKQ